MIVQLEIDGMSCHHCVQAVRSALAGIEGVKVIDVAIGSAQVEVDSEVRQAEMEGAVAAEGYHVMSATVNDN